ncbi:hypothetical protein DVH24_029613 [Malus domestica]|uniref:Uncharacterized protein n=1 Tax=Malus domestica TaxID=3750 RepID=A0A498HY36_MALDO|nr:hypothetical protein DVH24_029613 [Malus domestica]
MGFWTLLEVACMPIFQVLIISVLGALMATEYWNLLPLDARKSINKVVFVVFTPALVFSNVAKTITFGDIVSWWFMVVNIGLTFLVGGILGWIVVKIFKPKPYQEGVVIATVSSGNLGNLLLILVPAICNEDGNPFGDHSVCKTTGLAYVSFSMALGNFFIWTYSYQLIRTSSIRWKEFQAAEEAEEASKRPNTDLDADEETHLLKGEDEEQAAVVVSETSVNQVIVGFFVGSITVIKNIIIGDDAPLHVIEDSITQLGNGTIPCITLILGGNLIQGLRKPTIKVPTLLGVIIAKYIVMPAIGIGIVTGADKLGLLPSNSLFHFVLMLQFTLPPAMNIGTMTQLYDVAEAECSVIFLWTYLVAALALTVWSTIFMWILS